MKGRSVSREEAYALAHAAGHDAGNRAATAAGRTTWTADDYNAAVAQMNRLLDLWGACPYPDKE